LTHGCKLCLSAHSLGHFTRHFKQTLRATTWQSTFSSNTANTSYNAFWTEFKQAFDTHFPKVTRRNNRNKHKICNFLSQELLQARSTKL
jgi:hypothetical protein